MIKDLVCTNFRHGYTSYLPYGTNTFKMPNGEVIDIPSVLRNVRNNQIIKAYKVYLKKAGLLEKRKHSDSFLLTILNACPAERRKSVVCMDYFLADGLDVNFYINTIKQN